MVIDIAYGIGLSILVGFAIWKRRRRLSHVRLGRFRMGSVYIFRDKTVPGIVKIGMTARLCMTRKGEVSRDMAEGAELAQVYAIDQIPFPRAVERLAHMFLKRYRVKWPNGSCRGIEWFHAKGDRGIGRAIKAVERAAWLVRAAARKQKRWPKTADAVVSVWTISKGKVRRYKLFG